jgi:rhodanese-related sulfurtransferase
MASAESITVTQLSRLIGTPDVPVVVDICIDPDFNEDPRLIPTAFRHPHGDIVALAPALAGKKAVIVCQKGLKLSQGAAAILRTYGIHAEYLEGGNVAWRDAGQPLIPAAALPKANAQGETVWVTRHRPKIDRLACP